MTGCAGHHTSDTEGRPVWCPGHRASILECLVDIPTWVDWLREEWRRTVTAGEKLGQRGKGAASPSPSPSIEMAYYDLAGEIYQHVYVVTRHLHHRGPVLTTPAGLPHNDAILSAGVKYLIAQQDGWLDDPDFPVHVGLELIAWRRTVEAFTRRNDSVDRLHAPCPQCGVKGSLFRRNGADYVECGGCDLVWPESDYKRMVAVLLSD